MNRIPFNKIKEIQNYLTLAGESDFGIGLLDLITVGEVSSNVEVANVNYRVYLVTLLVKIPLRKSNVYSKLIIGVSSLTM